MRLHTLIFALVVLGARAATIAEKTELEFEKKLDDAVKEVLSKDEAAVENMSCEQELTANNVKDIDNNLRKTVPIADIPVKVIVEEVKPAIKSNIDNDKESDNEVVSQSEDNIKRVEVDLNNPGPPQRQEHETQNPEHFEENKQTWTSFIKQNVIETQNVFNHGVKTFQENLHSWLASNQQYIQIQQNLKELQQNFEAQINKLNETVQNYWPAESSNPTQSETEVSQTTSTVETSLKMLETNLKAGVKSLASGVQAIASEKGEGESSTSGQNPSGQNPSGQNPSGQNPFGQNPFATYFQQLQQQIQAGFQNMTNTFQSYLNQTQVGNSDNSTNSGPTNIFQNWSQGVQNLISQQGANQPASAQSDEGVPKPPSIWQSFQNIFNPLGSQQNQGQQHDTPASQPATPNRPIVQAIQNTPLYQTVANVFQPNKPAVNKPEDHKPEAQKPVVTKPEATQEGSNAVPVETKPQDDKQKDKPQVVHHGQSGPIKQILIDKNPIVQGLAGAVQRIQHTITNVEKPRDTDKEDEKDGEKGIIIIPIKKPGHQHRPGSHTDAVGIGNNIRRAAVPESGSWIEKEVPQDPKPDKEEEEKTPEVPDKTE